VRRDNPQARVIVTGCAAQTAPEAFDEMPEVDAVLGNDEKLRPEEWRALAAAVDERIMHVNDIMSVRDTAEHMIDGYGDRARAFLQVQNGCDHRCTFCIIPYGRGNSRSTPVEAVVEQARRLVEAGHRELVITGVDITSYGGDLEPKETLGTLVEAILDRVPDLFRLRLSSIDGAEIDDALLDRICGDERLAPYLHLSLQAGDNIILKRMKRRHNREQAIALCQTIRARRPDVAFGADIIAGFPTETDAMFEQSLNIIGEAGLQFVHVFPFSPRAGTPAARMPQLPRNVVKARAGRLRAKARNALHAFLDGLGGGEHIAVIESGGRARLGNFAVARLSAPAGAVGETALLKLGAHEGDMILATPV
jgi:threonylcarbamoyladenosine tRNA methylthiotransferase MtaB